MSHLANEEKFYLGCQAVLLSTSFSYWKYAVKVHARTKHCEHKTINALKISNTVQYAFSFQF